jgi:hypothetical protein
MRVDAEKLGWTKKSSIDSIVVSIEDYYYGYSWGKGRGHWEYHYVTSSGKSDTIKDVDGVDVEYGEVQNVDWQYYERFKKGLPGVGCCVAETALVDAWLKSVGIACNSVGRYPKQGGYYGHNHVIYYVPDLAVWKAYNKQVELGLTDHPSDIQVFEIRKLPIDYRFDAYCTMNVNLVQIRSMLVEEGVSSETMRRWLLYGEKPTITATTTTAQVQEGTWIVLSDASHDLVSQFGETVGDLGQPYADLMKVAYSLSNGSLRFRFDLQGKIPNETGATRATSVWYQVLFDVDSDPGTGYRWSSDFAPDYILHLNVNFEDPSGTPWVSSVLSTMMCPGGL